MSEAFNFSIFILVLHIVWSICSIALSIEAIISKHDCNVSGNKFITYVYVMCANVGLSVMSLCLTSGGYVWMLKVIGPKRTAGTHTSDNISNVTVMTPSSHDSSFQSTPPILQPNPSPSILQPGGNNLYMEAIYQIETQSETWIDTVSEGEVLAPFT